MDTVIVQVDCRPRNQNGAHQLGITVEPPYKKQQENNQNQQQVNHNNNNSKQTREQVQRGLEITKIQSGSIVDLTGQFRVGDIIVEANGVNLQNRSFQEAQRTLKDFVIQQSSHGPLQLKLLRRTTSSSTTSLHSITGTTQYSPPIQSSESPSMKKTPSPESPRHLVGPLNTRKLGTLHRVRLTKSADGGFGIKIAERDNMYGTKRPIYITGLTTTGSAYRDGQLKEGDMLLEVGGVDLTDKSQPEVTSMLKGVPVNKSVEFLVSRPRIQSKEPQQTEVKQCIDESEPGIFTFNIPLNDTKSAGLGLSLKYLTLNNQDMGIWIRKVITGGAAWKDGRLQPNDQILAINGLSLVGLPNSVASETLTAAVTRGIGPEATANSIMIKIHRRDSSVMAEMLHGMFDSEPIKPSSSVESWDEESVDSKSGEDRFRRDGFGRQSISEKRHAQLMASNFDTFRRNQKMREEREREKQRQMGETNVYVQHSTARVARNGSYRAAVSRSVAS